LAVFEDDAIFPPDSSRWLRAVATGVPDYVEALWLDATVLGENNHVMRATIGTVRLEHPPMRTHAYVMTRPLMERMYPVVSKFPWHIDRLYATAQVAPVVYAAAPSLVAQSSSPSDTLSAWRTTLAQVPGVTNADRWLRRVSPRA
jgi:hypothetical protein